MFTGLDQLELSKRYHDIAASGEHITRDRILRALEVAYAFKLMHKPRTLLDVGCGYGETSKAYAKRVPYVVGIDPVIPHDIVYGTELGQLSLLNGSLFDIYGSYDIITSHRCIMSILNWEDQKRALVGLYDHLAPNGKLILFEGFNSGLRGLNKLRQSLGLTKIPGDGKDRLMTLRLNEDTLHAFFETLPVKVSYMGFNTYYLITRVLYPLLIHPKEPQYNKRIHLLAARIQLAREYESSSHSLEECLIITKGD